MISNVPFSELVLQAQQMGYTEPDRVKIYLAEICSASYLF